MRTRDTVRQLANLFALPLGVAMNLIYPSLRGVDFGSDSGTVRTAFAAADYAFSIWGVIFLGHLIYAVYQALPAQRADPLLRRVGVGTAINGLATAVIGFLFGAPSGVAEMLLGWVMVLVLLAVLIVTEAQFPADMVRGRAFWLVRLPFSINFGWITVATLISTAQVLQNVAGWTGAPFPPQLWAAALIVAAVVLAVVMLTVRDNIAFAAVVVWGLIGIAVEKSAMPAVAVPAIGAALSIAVAIAVAIVFPPRQHAMESVG